MVVALVMLEVVGLLGRQLCRLDIVQGWVVLAGIHGRGDARFLRVALALQALTLPLQPMTLRGGLCLPLGPESLAPSQGLDKMASTCTCPLLRQHCWHRRSGLHRLVMLVRGWRKIKAHVAPAPSCMLCIR